MDFSPICITNSFLSSFLSFLLRSFVSSTLFLLRQVGFEHNAYNWLRSIRERYRVSRAPGVVSAASSVHVQAGSMTLLALAPPLRPTPVAVAVSNFIAAVVPRFGCDRVRGCNSFIVQPSDKLHGHVMFSAQQRAALRPLLAACGAEHFVPAVRTVRVMYSSGEPGEVVAASHIDDPRVIHDLAFVVVLEGTYMVKLYANESDATSFVVLQPGGFHVIMGGTRHEVLFVSCLLFS